MTAPALTPSDFKDAADLLQCDVAAIRAVAQVEAPRSGFNPDGSPVTLFEGHKFYRLTEGRFAISDPDLCFKVWTRQFYGKTWQAEQLRLQRAIALDRDAALQSASWGKFQIMGQNYARAGFTSLQDFVNAMYRSEREQLMAFVKFVQASGLTPMLIRHDWAQFANGYNGPAYRDNAYDTKLAQAYRTSQETT